MFWIRQSSSHQTQKILKEREVFKTTSELLDLLYFKDGNYLSVDSVQTQKKLHLWKLSAMKWMFWILRFDSFYLPLDFINKTMNFAHVKKQMKTWCGWMQSHAKWPVKSIMLNILWTHHVNDGQSRWLDDGGKTKGAGITRSSNHGKRSSEVQRRRFRQKLATSVVLKTGSFESDLVSCDFPSYMYNRFSGYVRPGLFE